MPMISRASEYAVRALTYLAAQPAASYHLARDMAAVLGIPAPFLAKILQPLVGRGLVDSQRGRSGGFRLAQKPGEITLFQIVDAQEQLGRVRQCMLGQAECTDERACPLHHYWKRTSDEYMAVLASTTLADLRQFCETRPGCNYPVPGAEAKPLPRAAPGADAKAPPRAGARSRAALRPREEPL